MKKRFVCILVFIMLITGCSNKETSNSVSNSTINSVTVEPTAEPVITPYQREGGDTQPAPHVTVPPEGTVYSPDMDLLDAEIALSIDKEKRLEMIDAIGEDAYWIGVISAGIYLNFQTPADSPIDDQQIADLTKMYTPTKVELTSSYDGHIIPADYYLANGNEDNDTIIFVHGARENRRNFPELINIYLYRGINVLAYDQRASGENTANLCTFGALEQYDLSQYIEYIDEKLSEDKKLYLYARSQGGETVGRVLGSDLANEKVDGAIMDCPLQSMRRIIEPNISNYVGPDSIKSVIENGDLITKYLFGFTMDDCDVTKYIGNTTVPVFVITSDCDTLVEKDMPTAIYDAITNSKKYLYVSKTAYHCWIHVMEPDVYREYADKFLDGSLFTE